MTALSPDTQEPGSLDQLALLKAAVSTDFHSRSAYTGHVTQTETVTIIAEDGTPFEKEVSFPISWDSISKILDLIRERARI